MASHPSTFTLGAGNVARWLGFGPRSAVAPAGDRRNTVRSRDLQSIGAFLDRHELEVSDLSLAAAQAYLTGSEPGVMRAIDRRLADGEPITTDWLHRLASSSADGGELNMLTGLIERLETSIEDFSRTSHAARAATSEYNSALAEHVDQLEKVDVAEAAIAEMAAIAQQMLKRTRLIERQMVQSESETRQLRTRLDEARRSAQEDHLTGLPNRRAFEQRFADEYAEARTNCENLCVALCDIDNFKLVNDVHGHEAGDRVLKLVATNLAKISGDRCHVARHGGEEFVLLFRDQPLPEVVATMDRLRFDMAARRLVNRATDAPIGQVTFSAGVTDVFAHHDRGAALRAADVALYRAKSNGRNRVEVGVAEDGSPSNLMATG